MSDCNCGREAGIGCGIEVTIPAGSIPKHKPKIFALDGPLEVHGPTTLHDSVTADKDVKVGGALDVAGPARMAGAMETHTVKPKATNTYALGSADKRYKAVHAQTIHARDVQIVTDNPDGTTSSEDLLARIDAQDKRIDAQDEKLVEVDQLLGQTAEIFKQLANGG